MLSGIAGDDWYFCECNIKVAVIPCNSIKLVLK